MQQQIFTDGIGKISVIGGVVRLDFMVYAPTDTDTPIPGQPRQTLTHQVLMGVEAFTRAAAQCAEAAKQLQAANQPAAAPVPKPAAPLPPAPAPVAAPVAAAPMTSAPTASPSATPSRPADVSPWTANLKPVAPMRPFP